MLNPDYKDMLSGLSGEKADFIIVGAFALAAHGLARATGDIDIFVRPDLENSKKVYKALQRFGAPLTQIQPESFSQEDVIFQIGVEPQRIDIISSITGVSFNEAWVRHETRRIEGLELPVLSIEDLITNKSATGRPQDKADVEWLKKHQRPK